MTDGAQFRKRLEQLEAVRDESGAHEAAAAAKLLGLVTRYHEASAGQVLDPARVSPLQLLANRQYVDLLALPPRGDEQPEEARTWSLILWWEGHLRGVSRDEALEQMIQEAERGEGRTV